MLPLKKNNLKSFFPRRSIVDLSTSSPSNSRLVSAHEDLFSLPGDSSPSKQCRVVASKRRPNASISTQLTFPKPSLTDRKETVYSHLLQTQLSTDQCVVYEPIVSIKAFSRFKPVFHKYLDYLEKNLTTDQAKICVTTQRHFVHLYTEELLRLNALDQQMMTLLKSVEDRHHQLYVFQKQWIQQHAKKVVESSDPPMFQVPGWPTAELNQLESLEHDKLKVVEMVKSGQSLCQSLSAHISELCMNSSNLMTECGLTHDPHDIRWVLVKSKPSLIEETLSYDVSDSDQPKPALVDLSLEPATQSVQKISEMPTASSSEMMHIESNTST